MDDFEDLQEGESVWVHLIAGAAAGTVEHCGMFPIDTIKTNMQALQPGGRVTNFGVFKTSQVIVSRFGLLGLFRGLGAMAAGAAPAHAMHFATYEFCKKQFGWRREGHHPFNTAAAGMCATVVSDAILTPMDAIKQKMQLGVKSYNGFLDCVRTVVRSEGFSALYASYTTTLLMNVPYNAIYFASYESLRRLLKRGTEKEFDPFAHIIAGGGAGSLAAAFTNPFDVAKTRLQTQADVGRSYSGMTNALITIWKEEGRSGYFSGIRPRIVIHSVSAALCWITYEWAKHMLNVLATP